jgi:ParB family transcriptional regulator, chromosome partitioning protein
MSKKSIIASFSALAQDKSPAPAVRTDFARVAGQSTGRVGAGVIGATQRSLTDIREERDRLVAMLEAGGLLDIDPNLIDPSPFPDRLPDDDQQSFDAFKQLMATEGQKVPVQLRAHPDQPGRYQVVYGHRRWRAALELGTRLKALVVTLSDAELAVAQGIENAARQDLSWIEKALFAWRMEKAGVRARDIRAALSVDDPELARFRSVCRALGEEVIGSIGRASGVGRPRWVSFGATVAGRADAVALILKSLAAAKVSSSDLRFSIALQAVVEEQEPTKARLPLQAPDGSDLGEALFFPGGIRLKVGKANAPAFASFMAAELPALMAKFVRMNAR